MNYDHHMARAYRLHAESCAAKALAHRCGDIYASAERNASMAAHYEAEAALWADLAIEMEAQSLPECNGCRVTLADEVLCCQEPA